jgi:hypothetical protein
MDSENYIKIQNKPVISIKKVNIIKNRQYLISIIILIFKEIFWEIFLIYPFAIKITEVLFFKEFDETIIQDIFIKI